MQKLSLVLALISLTSISLVGQAKKDFYVIDKSHSTVDFKIRHIGFSNVRGNFGSYEGNVYFDSDDIMKTSASLVIATESLETGAGGRNGVLKENFFQVEKYPHLIFNSTKVEKRGQQLYMKGNLTIGGVTKAVEIPFELISAPKKDQFEHQRVSLGGELTINRKDFEIYYRGNEFWDNVVEDNVKIEIEIGARSYNYIDTVFPFRDNSIGKLAAQIYISEGKEAARAKMVEVLADKEKKYLKSDGQIFRGAGYLMQKGYVEGAIDLLDFALELKYDMADNWKSEYLARKAQYLLKLDKNSEAKYAAEQALALDKNSLGMETLKQANIRSYKQKE